MSVSKKLVSFGVAATLAFGAVPAAAQQGEWGELKELAGRQWTTTSEGLEQVSFYEWEVPGEVLIGRHGTRARLAMVGEADFADTIQRMVLQPGGAIAVTYKYTDLRPSLQATIRKDAAGKPY